MCKSVKARPKKAGFCRSEEASVSAMEAEAPNGEQAPIKRRRPSVGKEVVKLGRPSKFCPEIAQAIVQHIIGGGHMSKLKELYGMEPATIWSWRQRHPEFNEAVARAEEARAELWSDQLIEIADTDEDPQRARVRIEARWKVIGSLLYRRYGVKQQVDINQNINVAVIQAEQLMQLSQRGRETIDVTPTVLKTVEKPKKSKT